MGPNVLSHCMRRWTQVIAEGELTVLGVVSMCIYAYMHMVYVWKKRAWGVVKGLWVFPIVSLFTWSPKNNKITWLPQDPFAIHQSGEVREEPRFLLWRFLTIHVHLHESSLSNLHEEYLNLRPCVVPRFPVKQHGYFFPFFKKNQCKASWSVKLEYNS